MTKRQFSIGNSFFDDQIDRNAVLVDKTLLIKEFLEDGGQVTLITRPRRWGKTLNLRGCPSN